MGGYDVTQMAIYNNAALANQFFPAAPIGKIVPGAFADLMFVDYHPYTPMNSGNLPWHIIFGFQQSMVTTTIARRQSPDERPRIADLERSGNCRPLPRNRSPRLEKYEEEVAKVS